MKKYITNSPEATKRLAKKLATQFKGGEVIGLVGELGTGKTVFVQGLAEALRIKEVINSPSFVLMKIYQLPNSLPAPRLRQAGKSQLSKKFQIPTFKQLVHIDCYRLADSQELIDIGVGEYLNKKDCLVVIEWANKVPEIKQYPKYKEIIFNEGRNISERMINVQ